jgi:hypothetical protein
VTRTHPITLEVRIDTDLPAEQLTNVILWNRFFSRLGINRKTYVESIKVKKNEMGFKPKQQS